MKGGLMNDSCKAIKIIMLEKNLNVTQLAKKTGYGISYVCMGIRGSRKSPHLRQAIARVLNAKAADLWKN